MKDLLNENIHEKEIKNDFHIENEEWFMKMVVYMNEIGKIEKDHEIELLSTMIEANMNENEKMICHIDIETDL